jgi:hypothetical protein
MLSHYVKLGPAPTKHAREAFLGAPDATEQAILDITNGGEEIKYSWNAGNGQPFLAIYGTRCVARGVRDIYFADTIFIWHL